VITDLSQVRHIIACDTEYIPQEGLNQRPVCVCYEDLMTGNRGQVWCGDGISTPCPWPTGPRTLLVLFAAEADCKTFIALGWELPTAVVCLYTEYKNLRNGGPRAGEGLLDALHSFGYKVRTHAAKEACRDLVLQGHWTPEERTRVLEYCSDDVRDTKLLWSVMKNKISFPHAIIRGRFLPAVARMEVLGIPMDAGLQKAVRDHSREMLTVVAQEVSTAVPVINGLTVKRKLFTQWISHHGWNWPLTPTGLPKMDDDTLRDLSFLHPGIPLLRDYIRFERITSGQAFPIGPDGMCRYRLWPFGQESSRSNPSSSEFVFGAACWQRAYIRPPPGYALCYLDYSSQEPAVAAWVSGDRVMQEDYASGDIYLAFGKRAGLVPADATKHSHREMRDCLKIAVLAMNYGMSAESLSYQIGTSKLEAKFILRAYKELYPTYHAWSGRMLNATLCGITQTTVFGWQRRSERDYTPRGKSVVNSIKNYPVQSNAAEMTRMACIRAIEAGLKICCPVHDALLLLSPIETFEANKLVLKECMRQASVDITGSLVVRTGSNDIVYPSRYVDERGASTWNRVKSTLESKGWWKDG